MYILLTATHKLRLRYEIETGTKERFSLRKNPETVRKRLRAAAAARKENHNVRVAARQHGGWDAAEAEFLEGSWLALDWEIRTPALN